MNQVNIVVKLYHIDSRKPQIEDKKLIIQLKNDEIDV